MPPAIISKLVESNPDADPLHRPGVRGAVNMAGNVESAKPLMPTSRRSKQVQFKTTGKFENQAGNTWSDQIASAAGGFTSPAECV